MPKHERRQSHFCRDEVYLFSSLTHPGNDKQILKHRDRMQEQMDRPLRKNIATYNNSSEATGETLL
jgi:hypothetical protein